MGNILNWKFLNHSAFPCVSSYLLDLLLENLKTASFSKVSRPIFSNKRRNFSSMEVNSAKDSAEISLRV